MWKDKNRLSWFYISKLFMIIYWLFGGQNVLVVTIQLLIKCSELAYELAIKAYNYYQDESAKEGSQKPVKDVIACNQPLPAHLSQPTKLLMASAPRMTALRKSSSTNRLFRLSSF